MKEALTGLLSSDNRMVMNNEFIIAWKINFMS